MVLIASGVAIVIALAALWLANAAHAQVSNTFEEYSVTLAKQVREAHSEFEQKVDRLRADCRELVKIMHSIESQAHENAEKIHVLTQRVGVVEHELKSLSDSIPSQYRRQVKRRDDKSA